MADIGSRILIEEPTTQKRVALNLYWSNNGRVWEWDKDDGDPLPADVGWWKHVGAGQVAISYKRKVRDWFSIEVTEDAYLFLLQHFMSRRAKVGHMGSGHCVKGTGNGIPAGNVNWQVLQMLSLDDLLK